MRNSGLRTFAITVSVSLFCSVGAARAEVPTVAFGGFALASYGTDRDSLIESYPVASRLLLCDKPDTATGFDCTNVPSGLSAHIALAFTSTPFKNMTVTFEKFNADTMEGLVLVPVVTRESLVSADEGSSYSYAYRVFVDVMLLRFRPGEVQFVSSTPYILNYFDMKDRQLSQTETEKVFEQIYSDDSLGFNLFDEVARVAAEKLDPSIDGANYAQLTDVSLSDEVVVILEQTYPENTWRQQIGQFLSSNLVETSGAPLLPSRLSDDVTDKINIVFADTNQRLSVPIPSYEIKLDVERFVRHEQASGSEQIICFIVAVRLRVEDAFGEEKVNIRFVRKRDSCGATDRGTTREDKMYFPESLFSLLTNVSAQLDGSIDRSFISSHVEQDSQAIEQLNVLTTLLLRK